MKRTILAALGAAVLCAPAVRAQDILFGSTSASSSHYGYIVAVGKLINDSDSGLSVTVVETGAAMDNIRRMERGQIDLGIITTNVVQHAVAGKLALVLPRVRPRGAGDELAVAVCHSGGRRPLGAAAKNAPPAAEEEGGPGRAV